MGLWNVSKYRSETGKIVFRKGAEDIECYCLVSVLKDGTEPVR